MRDYKDYKPKGRTSKKPSGKKLTSMLLKAGLALTIILALAIAAGYSYKRLLTASYFALKEIVVTGEKRVKREEIITLSGARIGENILAMKLNKMAREIESQPWVERATVRRVLPRGLSIAINEREPFAILKTDILFYLDRGGTPFKELDSSDDTGYPLLTGMSKEEVESDELARDSLMKTLDFIETEVSGWPAELSVSEIRVNRNQGMSIFSNDVEVKIGFGEYKNKIERLRRVLEDLKGKGKKAGYIDLTYTGQVVVR